MRKIAYITYDFFLDVDYPIVKELNNQYQLFWIVFIKTGVSQRFTIDEVKQYAKINNIHLDLQIITSRFRSPKQLINDLFTVFKLRQLKADIYYYQGFFNPYQPLLTKLFLNTKKIVIAIHDVVPHKKFRSRVARLNEKLYFQMFRNYHLFSQTQTDIYKKKYPNKNVLTARLFLKDFGPTLPTIDRDKINFLFFGVIQHNKGLDYLIEASNMLSEKYNNFKVTIAGKCADFKPYQELISDNSVFDMHIKVVPNAEIPNLFGNANFLVLPYRDVTQSGPLLIAYNYGVPVIASDFPGFQEYVSNGKTGYLFEACNSKALYGVMERILLSDDSIHKKMVIDLNDYVKREISLKGIVGKYINFFEQLISNRV